MASKNLTAELFIQNNDGIAPVPLFKRLHRPRLCTILFTPFWPPEVKNMMPEFYGFWGLGRMMIQSKPLWLHVVITYRRIFFQIWQNYENLVFPKCLILATSWRETLDMNKLSASQQIILLWNGCLWFCGKLFCKWIWSTISAIHDLSRSST